jgi:PAS domain S-box-containing protein
MSFVDPIGRPPETAGSEDPALQTFTPAAALASLSRKLEIEDSERQAIDAASAAEDRERLNAALAASGTGTYRWDIRTGRLFWDENLDRLFGLQRQESPKTIDEYLVRIHPDDRPLAAAAVERSAIEGKDCEGDYRVIWPDGSIHWLFHKGKIYFDEKGEPAYMTGAAFDITSRKRSEEALRQKNEHWRVLMHHMPVKLGTARPNGYAVYANDRWLVYTGQTLAEFQGAGWMVPIHPEDLPRARKIWRQAVATGDDYEVEFRLRRASDGQYRWHLGRGWPLRGLQGETLEWLSAVVDIHDLREAEEALRRSNEDLQHFAYAISHDLKEPLRSVRSFADLALRSPAAADPELAEYLGFVAAGAARMHRLLNDLLTFSSLTRGRADRSVSVDLESVVSWSLENLHSLIEEAGAEIVCDPLPFVKGDFARLGQVFQNLISNAIRHRAPDRPPKIRISALRTTAGDWQITVADNGPGIDPRFHQSIFKPFQRLHPTSKAGSGLGLAIVHRTIEQHGGRIWVESEPGQGSRFCFVLPLL